MTKASLENPPVYDWQKQKLDERLEAAEQSPDGWLTWEQVKERVAALRSSGEPPQGG